MAGLIGSTLWLMWLVVIGVRYLRMSTGTVPGIELASNRDAATAAA